MGVSGHQRSPAVTDGAVEPQVASPPRHAAGMMQVGDSDCGPESHGLESHRWSHSVPAAHLPCCV